MTTVAYVLLGLSVLVTLGNWSLMIGTLITKQHMSFVVLIGGISGFVGCALLPAIGWKLGLLALAADPGCWLLALPLVWVVRRLRSKKAAL